jgi:hypothetical protein
MTIMERSMTRNEPCMTGDRGYFQEQNIFYATGAAKIAGEISTLLDQGQIKRVHLNRSTTTSNLQQDQVFAAKRHKIGKVLMFPLLRPPCAFLWLIVLLSAFTDNKKTIRLNR